MAAYAIQSRFAGVRIGFFADFSSHKIHSVVYYWVLSNSVAFIMALTYRLLLLAVIIVYFYPGFSVAFPGVARDARAI